MLPPYQKRENKMTTRDAIHYCSTFEEYRVTVEGSTCYESDEQAARDTFKAMSGKPYDRKVINVPYSRSDSW